MNHPSTPASTRRQFALSLCVFALVVALCELVQEPMPTAPDGAWSFLFAPLWLAYGKAGLVGFWAAVAVGFASLAAEPVATLRRPTRGFAAEPHHAFAHTMQ
ncbi:MAG TPA: hypothetical protein VLJ86_19425 [Ramlibacter sp.]|nr:hypothetical protein [Ramlibacter sp.]